MGARPLRRAIQRYIEDPLADEVLRQGPDTIASGTTVLVDRDESAAEDSDHPLTLKLVKPRKPRAEKDAEDAEKQPVTVGAPKSEDSDNESGDAPGDGQAAADESLSRPRLGRHARRSGRGGCRGRRLDQPRRVRQAGRQRLPSQRNDAQAPDRARG